MQFNKKLTSLLLLFVFTVGILLSGCAPKAIIDLDSVPEYSGEPFVEINGGVPFFEEDEITEEAYESYSALDMLGRCTVAVACLGIELMPTEKRENITSVTPSGWEYNGTSNNNTYDFIEDDYVYNRCHLIAFQLAGENANEKNLITGTRYLNIEGMLPFENEVAEYIETTENHVMYRVTPIYSGTELVARGVLMEAYSVEDDGRGVCFCIYAYNVQPGVTIDYLTGINVANGEPLPETEKAPADDGENADNGDGGTEILYVLNIKSKKFHYPDKNCSDSIKPENREEITTTREKLIEDGYDACGSCNP